MTFVSNVVFVLSVIHVRFYLNFDLCSLWVFFFFLFNIYRQTLDHFIFLKVLGFKSELMYNQTQCLHDV